MIQNVDGNNEEVLFSKFIIMLLQELGQIAQEDFKIKKKQGKSQNVRIGLIYW